MKGRSGIKSARRLLGVDMGTTFIKAVVYDDAFRVEGQAKVRTPWTQTSSGAEADPERLAGAAVSAIERALAACVRLRAVDGVGVTGMGESGVLVDGGHRTLAPVIAWHDRRGLDHARDLGRAFPDFAQRAGRRPTERCSIVKWRDLAAGGVDLSGAVRWYSVAEWIVWRLGGSPASDASLASRTGCIDVRRGTVDVDLVEWAGGTPQWFGPVAPSGTPAGRGAGSVPDLEGAVLAVAGLDAYASALAVGAIGHGVAFLSCGTSGAAIRALRDRPSDDAMERAAALDFTIDCSLDGVGLVALGATPCGLILQPLYDVLGPPGASDRGDGGDDLSGRLAPATLWRRAFDAVADGQTRLVRDVERFGGALDELVTAGGWIAQPGLRDALERRLGRALVVHADENTAALGAAMLALRALSEPAR